MPQGGTDLIFYGDSLTELWRGTAWGYTGHLGTGVPAVFSQFFGQYSTEICGSAGARARGRQHNILAWRHSCHSC